MRSDEWVVTTVEQLRAAVKDAVHEVIADDSPVLLEAQSLARLLRCEVADIDKLVQRGLPVADAGELPRFEVRAVLAWLLKGALSR